MKMNIIWRSLKANGYKMHHSRLLWIHILLPLMAAVVFNLYFFTATWEEREAAELYIQTVAIAFPLMIAIVITLVYEADAEAGSFCMFHMLADKKAKGHLGNFLALLFYGSVSSILAVIGFALLYRGGTGFVHGVQGSGLVGVSKLPMSFFVEITALLLTVNIVSYLLQYMLCYTFGKGVSLGYGIITLLLGALLYLGIGDYIWKWIPCSYGIRMSSYYFIVRTPVKDASLKYFKQYVQEDMENGAWMIAGMTIFLGIIFYLWGNKWEALGSTER